MDLDGHRSAAQLMIRFWVGGRELEDARNMLADLIASGDEKPLFTSDELPHYAEALAELFHTMVPAESKGNRGRPEMLIG